MFDRIKRSTFAVASAVGTLVTVAATSAHAALSVADQTSILAGITASDTVFYAIGGGLLVVMAGIWGFKRVKSLISG